MIFSNDLIKSILEDHLFDADIYQGEKFQCGFDELVEGIANELSAIAGTKRRLHDLRGEERMLTEEHEKAMGELQVSRSEIKANCQHHSTTYYPDASGGNDSSTTCDICGKAVQRGG